MQDYPDMAGCPRGSVGMDRAALEALYDATNGALTGSIPDALAACGSSPSPTPSASSSSSTGPGPGRVPRRGGTSAAPGRRAPKARLTGIRVKLPVEVPRREAGKPARGRHRRTGPGSRCGSTGRRTPWMQLYALAHALVNGSRSSSIVELAGGTMYRWPLRAGSGRQSRGQELRNTRQKGGAA